MRIRWHGHSCFAVESGGYTVVFDPYEDGKVPGCGPLRLAADAVYCSHEHGDHNARDLVKLSGRACPLRVETVASFHDDKQGALRGPNTIHILHAEGMRLVHLGDLGHELTGAALKAVTDAIGARVVIPMHYRLGRMGFDVIGTLDQFTKLCENVRTYDGDTLELRADTPAQTAVLTYGK